MREPPQKSILRSVTVYGKSQHKIQKIRKKGNYKMIKSSS